MVSPRLEKVKALNDYNIILTYEKSEQRIFDVSPYIKGDWYGKLRDISYFKSVRVVGDTVVWTDGQDLAPHELYDNSILVDSETLQHTAEGESLVSEISAMDEYSHK